MLAIDLDLHLGRVEWGHEKCSHNANHQCARNYARHQPAPAERCVPILKQDWRQQPLRILNSRLLNHVGGRVYDFVHVETQFKKLIAVGEHVD